MEDTQIRHFKLINGEQIIAAVNSKNNDNWFIGTPVQVTVGFINAFQFAPWFPFSDEENFKISFANVIQSTSVDESVKEAYIKFVLKLKENPPKANLDQRTAHELLEQLEAEVDEQMAEVFENEGLINPKKETIH